MVCKAFDHFESHQNLGSYLENQLVNLDIFAVFLWEVSLPNPSVSHRHIWCVFWEVSLPKSSVSHRHIWLALWEVFTFIRNRGNHRMAES